MIMSRKSILTLVVMALCLTGWAKVRLPHLISDNMVLQQQTDARLWGWARPGQTVTVSTSWSTDTYKVKTGRDGRWLVSVKTPRASFTPLSVTFDDSDCVGVQVALDEFRHEP